MKALVHTAPYVNDYQDWEMPLRRDLLVRVRRAPSVIGIKGTAARRAARRPSSWARGGGVWRRSGANVTGFAPATGVL